MWNQNRHAIHGEHVAKTNQQQLVSIDLIQACEHDQQSKQQDGLSRSASGYALAGATHFRAAVGNRTGAKALKDGQLHFEQA
jgi:hypothetical protein